MNTILFKNKSRAIVLLLCTILVNILCAQSTSNIKGNIHDGENNAVLAFASIGLYRCADSSLVQVTISNDQGEFMFNALPVSDYYLTVHYMGYKPLNASVHKDTNGHYSVGDIYLEPETEYLEEVVFIGERIKAKKSDNSIKYYINAKTYAVSNTGSDILKNIPGVTIGLMKNISLNGSENIKLLVDGKERDRNYINQLDASQIDKVEVINTPGAKYESTVTGVINIILKKERVSGVNGHVYSEIPTNYMEVFAFPGANINYGLKKLNMFTSYGAELAYFNKTETDIKAMGSDLNATRVLSNQYLRQEKWSHRLQYGFDFFINEKNQVNLYAFYSKYADEDNGLLEMEVKNNEEITKNIYRRNEEDKNSAAFYSLYYKHSFNKPKHEFTVDLSHYHFKAANTTSLTNNSQPESVPDTTYFTNTNNPLINYFSIKMDYTNPLLNNITFDAGVKSSIAYQAYQHVNGFTNEEIINALYGSIAYSKDNFRSVLGLRIQEYTSNGIINRLSILPTLSLNYKISEKQNLNASFKYTQAAPSLQQLNPQVELIDFYATKSGNSELGPEYVTNCFVDYSISIKNNFISLGLFYDHRKNALFEAYRVTSENLLESMVSNYDVYRQYGIQVNASLKLGKSIDINTNSRIYKSELEQDNYSDAFMMDGNNRLSFDSKVSAIVNPRSEMSISTGLQYFGSTYEADRKRFREALYQFTVLKSFNKKLKIGTTALVPLQKSYTYRGFEAKGNDYYHYSEGNVSLSGILFLVKIKYQFSSGKAVNKIDRKKDKVYKVDENKI